MKYELIFVDSSEPPYAIYNVVYSKNFWQEWATQDISKRQSESRRHCTGLIYYVSKF